MPDIDFGQISETLNNKTDRDLRNVDTTAKADAVIDYQEPTSANNYTWYRKYKSGWVEQGGYIAADSTIYPNKAVALPVEMADTTYNVLRLFDRTITGSTGFGWDFLGIGSTAQTSARTTTTLYCTMLSTGHTVGMWWQVSGMAAS